jgi:hypothetical protein
MPIRSVNVVEDGVGGSRSLPGAPPVGPDWCNGQTGPIDSSGKFLSVFLFHVFLGLVAYKSLAFAHMYATLLGIALPALSLGFVSHFSCHATSLRICS